MKKRKIAAFCLGGFCGLFFLMLFFSIIPRKWHNKSSDEEICYAKICVADNGFHSDILLPADDRTLDYKYLGYGWGDRFFFMKNPEQTGLKDKAIGGFKALFLPTATAMRVSKYSRLPKKVTCIKISEKDYLNLKKYIESSFELSENGERIFIKKDLHYRNTFYAGKGIYSALRNCNSWTAEALRKADLNTPVWGGFSFSIMLYLKTNCRERN